MESVTLQGSPGQIGLQHGTLLKDKVVATWGFYSRTLFGNQIELLEDLGTRYLEAINAFSDDYGSEIEALSKGAGLLDWQVAVLNARTEIFHAIKETMGTAECTALYFPGSRILGQNWDWMKQLESLFVVMRINRADGHQILQIAEPGILGKIGLNSGGLGVCLNIISGGSSPVAVPIHILLRYVLDSTDPGQVLERIRETPLGTYSNILMADDQGRSVNMEFSGTEMKVVDYGDDIPVHTNHYLSDLKNGRDNTEDPLYLNSAARFNRAREMLGKPDQTPGLDKIRTVLMDTDNEKDPICRAYEYVERIGMMVGTVSSVIMDLPNRALHVTKGHPRQCPYQDFTFR